MKLFISYGHDGNAEFVHRIENDLRKSDHETWIDSARIHERNDWRGALMEGMDQAEWTVAFLSRHSMRAGSVTPQEIAYADEIKGGCVTTVLIEKMELSEIPPPVRRFQYVDMSDWASLEAGDPAAFEDWYRRKFNELLHRLGPENAVTHAVQMKRLSELLAPLPGPQYPHKDQRIDGFVGREWLIARVDAWRKGMSDERLFWLHGAPGSGKSAFAAWITAHQHCNVVALNLCDWRVPERRETTPIVHTLAWQLARRLPDYRHVLLGTLERLVRSGDRLFESQSESGAAASALARLDPMTRFNRLITQPLKSATDGGQRDDRMIIVIDGLDEAVAPPPKDEPEARRHPDATLVQVLRHQAAEFPEWVALLVTSRPEWPMPTAFAGLPHLRVDAEAAQNRQDLRLYAERWLTPLVSDADRRAKLLDALTERAGGSFIYLRKLRQLHDLNPDMPLDVAHLPQGIDGVYHEWFTRQFERLDYRSRIARVIGPIVAANVPVPREILIEATHFPLYELQTILEALGGLFERTAGGWVAFHKGLEEWLTDPDRSGSEFSIDVNEATEQLREAVWSCFIKSARAVGGARDR